MGGRGGSSGNDPDPPKPPDDPNNPKPPDPDDPDTPNNPSDPTTWTWDDLQDYIRRPETSDEDALSKARQWLDAQSTSTVTLQDDFMPAPETFKRITFNGMEVLYAPGQEAIIADSLIELAVALERLPSALKKHVSRIIMSTQYADGVAASIGGDDTNIVFYNGDPINTGYLAHETAHRLAVERWSSVSPPNCEVDSDIYYERLAQGLPVRSDYGDAINSGEPAVSTYGGTSDAEDFAEAVRMYIADRSRLQQIAPKRYAVIHRMMTDSSYGG